MKTILFFTIMVLSLGTHLWADSSSTPAPTPDQTAGLSYTLAEHEIILVTPKDTGVNATIWTAFVIDTENQRIVSYNTGTGKLPKKITIHAEQLPTGKYKIEIGFIQNNYDKLNEISLSFEVNDQMDNGPQTCTTPPTEKIANASTEP